MNRITDYSGRVGRVSRPKGCRPSEIQGYKLPKNISGQIYKTIEVTHSKALDLDELMTVSKNSQGIMIVNVLSNEKEKNKENVAG